MSPMLHGIQQRGMTGITESGSWEAPVHTPAGIRLGPGPSILLHSGVAEVKFPFFQRLTGNGKAKLPDRDKDN